MSRYFYVLVSLLVLSAVSINAQFSSHNSRQATERQSEQLSAPLKDNMFFMKESIPNDSPLFTFDSLNVSYQGSWGFGQSFSISSDTAGDIVFYKG